MRPWGGNSGLLGPVGVSGPRHVFTWIIPSQRGQLSSESLFYGQWIINNLLKTTPQSLEICIFSLLATGSHYFLVHTILLLMAARCSFYLWTGCSQSQKSFWRGSRWKTKLSTGCVLQRLVMAGPKLFLACRSGVLPTGLRLSLHTAEEKHGVKERLVKPLPSLAHTSHTHCSSCPCGQHPPACTSARRAVCTCFYPGIPK